MRRKTKVIRKAHPTFAIVVEGECELWYFQMLKRNERHLRVNIEPKIPQRKSLEEQFTMVVNLSEDYSRVFWIIDLDVVLSASNAAKRGVKTPMQVLKEYSEKVTSHYPNVTIIINNPCLEYWFLIHFVYSSRIFGNCGAVEKELKKAFPGYTKSKGFFTKDGHDIYSMLKPHLKTAIQHSKRSGKMNFNQPVNSISGMHLFFEALKALQ